MLAPALRKLGYEVAITPMNPATAENGMNTNPAGRLIFDGVADYFGLTQIRSIYIKHTRTS